MRELERFVEERETDETNGETETEGGGLEDEDMAPARPLLRDGEPEDDEPVPASRVLRSNRETQSRERPLSLSLSLSRERRIVRSVLKRTKREASRTLRP